MRLKLLRSAIALGAFLLVVALSDSVLADSGAPAAPTEPVRSPELQRLLGLLAERAAVHHSLLYRFSCVEDLTRRVERMPGETMHERYGIVLERGENGVARATREKLDREDKVRLNRKGEPLEAVLPHEFDPIANAVPHAQAAVFTPEGQEDLVFHLLSDSDDDGTAYRIRCSNDHVAVEFIDRYKPKPYLVCSAKASGQMCIDPHNGEISALVFYGLDKTPEGWCLWNRATPFAMVDQGLIETKTGARFPSRIKTIFTVRPRRNAVFEQRFEECGFTHVKVNETYGGVHGESRKP